MIHIKENEIIYTCNCCKNEITIKNTFNQWEDVDNKVPKGWYVESKYPLVAKILINLLRTVYCNRCNTIRNIIK
jgi:hypothetical protein